MWVFRSGVALLLFDSCLGQYLESSDSRNFLRSQRGLPCVKFDHSKLEEKCYREENRCDYENFAEQAEDVYSKVPFGTKNFIGNYNHVDSKTQAVFKKFYSECTDLGCESSCKHKFKDYLDCTKSKNTFVCERDSRPSTTTEYFTEQGPTTEEPTTEGIEITSKVTTEKITTELKTTTTTNSEPTKEAIELSTAAGPIEKLSTPEAQRNEDVIEENTVGFSMIP